MSPDRSEDGVRLITVSASSGAGGYGYGYGYGYGTTVMGTGE